MGVGRDVECSATTRTQNEKTSCVYPQANTCSACNRGTYRWRILLDEENEQIDDVKLTTFLSTKSCTYLGADPLSGNIIQESERNIESEKRKAKSKKRLLNLPPAAGKPDKPPHIIEITPIVNFGKMVVTIRLFWGRWNISHNNSTVTRIFQIFTVGYWRLFTPICYNGSPNSNI